MLLTALVSWWRRPLKHLKLVMYTRQGCHLCESAWRELEQRRKRYGFTLEAVDIDDDPALQRDYGNLVPVVAISGRVRFRGQLNPVLLERLLRAEARKLAANR